MPKQNIFVLSELFTFPNRLLKLRLTKLLIFPFYGLLLLLAGCATTNQAVLPKQVFHDITSHYNAYFNVNEKLKNVFNLSLQYHKDKFDSVIPVYYYTDSKEFTSYSGDLDDVIKRSTQAIQLHNPSNWSDDHFLLIGVANYLKGDYDKAGNSFKYITTQFKEGVDYVKVMRALGRKVGKYRPAKRKPPKQQVQIITNADGTKTLQKVDNRPEKSVWIHTPARSEALLWLIQTYTRQKKFDEASTVITYTRGDNLFYKNYDAQLDLAEADLRVTQKKYGAAIEPLEKYLNAKKIRKRKKLRVRPLFTLAQCYAALGNNAKAIATYNEVLRSHPNYDMEFYAKIKMAKLGRGGMEMRALLAGMAKDGKYKEYWDQVYYELALLSLAENNRDEGKRYLHESIRNSTTNDDQKASSFLKLAELDYEDESYVSAKFLYDSTLSFMSKNDSRYPDIEQRDKLLDNLVKQLTTIAQEDSLQKLAALPKDQLEKYIRNAILKKEQEEAEKKAKEAANKQQSQLNNFQNTNPQNPANPKNETAGSSWYFYNTTSRAAGYNDFVKKWGKRKLEENWRRSNKSSTATEEDSGANADSTSAKKDTVQAKTGTVEEQMMDAVPTTPEKMAKSVDKSVDAYYDAGTIYKDGLESYSKAEDMFETVNRKYPKHKLLLESYYNLYLIALHQKANDKVEKYKNLIMSEFPESVIAKILRDPNYINEAKKKEHISDDYYQSAYNDYASNRLDSAWYKCQMADLLLKPNPLSDKFQLLGALVLAKQNRLTDYIQVLNSLINKSKDVAVKKTATELLALLNKSALQQIDLSKDPARRDSMNSFVIKPNYGRPDSSQMELLQKLNEAKQKAQPNGTNAKTDTAGKQNKPVVVKDTANKAPTVSASGKDTTSKPVAIDNSATKDTANTVSEDTTSDYKRSDNDVHYFIIYIKDPTTPQSTVMSTMAKVDAYNSTQFSSKRLQSKQVLIDAKNKVLNYRQFKNKDDAMSYFNSVKGQGQLFSDLGPSQYAIAVISTTNFSTLLSEKNMDDYVKFFNRVYK